MGKIDHFPASLQPVIQQGFVEREFQQALSSRLGFRAVAERETTHIPVGEAADLKRVGLNGAVEHYRIANNHYAATTDLNMVTSRVGIASQFLLNAAINGEQAARSLDELARNALRHAYLRPETTQRVGRHGCPHDMTKADGLTMSALLDAVATLRKNGAPEIDSAYNCYLDPISARQLFADADFRQLFTGATSANQVFRQGMVNDFLGLRFVPVSERDCEQHPKDATLTIRRAIVCGKGALIEADYDGLASADVAPVDSIVSVVDGVAMVTREPIDRLQQIIAQSWYWMGGFDAPHEMVDGGPVYRRAVVVESTS